MTSRAPLIADRCSSIDVQDLASLIDQRLGALLPAPRRAGELGHALRYALLAPGKRIRPILTILAAGEAGGDGSGALDAGCALEMVHAASLVLDDMPSMDDARERRGQPATHVKFGEDVAMLGAITLLSTAFATLSAMRGVDPMIRCRLVEILAKAVGPDGLSGGQYADLRPAAIGDSRRAIDTNKRKTGALFVAAFEMATTLQGLDMPATNSLRHCAEQLGQAYQMLDDLIDGDRQVAPDRTEDAGKLTILSLVGRDAAQRRLRTHVEGAIEGIRPDGPLATFIRSLFRADVMQPEAV